LQKTEQQTYNNYIGGSWIPAENGNTYEIRNPADYDDVVGYFQESSAADALAAIRAAKEAAAVWRKVPPPQRGLVLYEAWNIMKQRAEDFARIITREEGKPLADSRGEVKRSLNVLEFMAGEGRRLSGDSIPSELQNTLIYTQKRPLGVVAVITPWNFPLSIPMWKIAPALISGNAVVFKPASSTPFTAVNLVKLFAEAGLPKGVLNLVTGPGGSVGKEIIGSEDVRAVSFTGSTETGRWIYESSSKTMKKVQCEMGGKNAVVVTENADLDLAVEGVVQGAFGSTGQRCTATSRVVVFESIKETFLGKLAERASRLKVGSGFDPATDVGPLASKSQLEKVMGYITGAKEEGAKLFHGGRRLSGSGYDKGYYVEPTIFDDVTPKMKIGCEEVFGPVLSILTAENLESAIELANDSRFGLSGSIYSSNLSEVMKYVDEIEVGMIHVNSPTLGGEAQAPFGGVKESGLGTREQGRKAVDFFTEEIVVYVDYTGKRRDAKFI
jgi:acyl-CoA reductase-like NAD-dependent aldehyde dehydrogenase